MQNLILDIIQNKLIPWVESSGIDNIAVAQAKLQEMKRPRHFGYTPQKLLGPRQGVRSFTFGMTTAEWPRDHMLESSSPLLLFITSGNADLRLGDYWLHASEGQGAFVLTDVPRKDGKVPYLHPKNRKTGFCSTLNFTEVRGRLHIWHNHSHGETHEVSKTVKPIYTLDDRALQLLNQMQHLFDKADPGHEVICVHLLKAFLLTLQNDLQAGRFIQPGLLRQTSKVLFDNDDPILQAQQYVRTNLHESLTLQNVARQVYLSRTQFAMRFHQQTRQTFNQFVTQCRMEQAKVLLLETDYTLTFVSVSVGYRSLTYFRQVFLKHFGLSPHEFRRKENVLKEKHDKANP